MISSKRQNAAHIDKSLDDIHTFNTNFVSRYCFLRLTFEAMTDTEPKIDFAAIDYPTDKLTVKMMRQRAPHAFDTAPKAEWSYLLDEKRTRYPRSSMQNVLGYVIDSERQMAEWAFQRALGLPVEDPAFPDDRDTHWECLSNEYIKWGLARGEREASELLRRLEAQAAAQARQHGGKPR